jgi:AraC family transcriptional regulator, transcriptional activator of the genes for pyochelin and ferripyochelin receptors
MGVSAPTVLATRFNWLGSDEPSFLELDHLEQDIPKIPHLIPETTGYGWFEAMHLPLNQVIRRSTIQFKPGITGALFSIAEVKEQFAEPVLCVQSARSGCVVLSDNLSGRDFIVSKSSSIFMHADCRDNNVRLDTSENLELVSFIIGKSVLSRLIGKECAQSLLEGLGVAMAPAVTVNKIPQHIDALLHSSLPDHLIGSIAKLHAQAKVLDYICCLYKHVVPAKEKEQPKRDIQNRINQLHDDLVRLDGKLPILTDLARRYDLSAHQMSHEFRNRYGKSLYSYITEIRLHEAHSALKTTDLPMKTIAKNLGYSHVNHFSTAFGKQFGYSPGSLRKRL